MNFMFKLADIIYNVLQSINTSSAPLKESIKNKMFSSLENYSNKNSPVKIIITNLNLLFMTSTIILFFIDIMQNTTAAIVMGILSGFCVIPCISILISLPLSIFCEKLLINDINTANKMLSFENFISFVLSYVSFYIGIFVIILILL